jgi:hypothetical protein
VSTFTLKKSAAAMAPQCALRKVFQGIVLPRSGAGSMPCSVRMRGPSELEAQVLECASKPRVAPRRIFARHPRQQPRDLVTSGWWTARTPAGPTSIILRRDLLAVPPKDGLRCRERCHLGQKPSAERLPPLREQPSLGIREAKTLGPEPGPQHAVLGAQVLDRFALAATDPASDQQNEEVKRSGGCHGRDISSARSRRDARPKIGRDRLPEHYAERANQGHDQLQHREVIVAAARWNASNVPEIEADREGLTGPDDDIIDVP